MKNKVHFVHFNARPGGIEVKRPLLIANLKNFIFSVFVIRPPEEKDQKNVYEGLSIKISYGENGYIGYWKLLKYARKHRREIFHVFNIGPYALLMLRLGGVEKLIYAIHGTIYWKTRNQRMFRRLVWKLAMKPQYFITSNSVFSGDVFIKQVLRTAKPLLLYNPIDSNYFSEAETKNINSENVKIIYSGRLAHGKNLNKWIAIAGTIYKKHPNFRFEIYGDGPLKTSLHDLIRENSLQEVVSVKGFCQNVKEIYQQADILLFLSEYESFGNVVVESILCETPVIVSAIPSMKEIFKNFPEFLVTIDDNLAYNILQKIDQLDLLKLSAKKAAIEFRERFSLHQHLAIIEKIYASFYS